MSSLSYIYGITNWSLDTSLDSIAPSSIPFALFSTLSADGNSLYWNDSSAGTLVVYNLVTNTITANIPTGTQSSYIAVSLDGSKLYTTNTNFNKVLVISTATNTVISTITMASKPNALALTPDGLKLYVTSEMLSTVTVIDTATNAVLTTINVGGISGAIVASPDSAHVYAIVGGNATLAAISTATNTVVGQVSMPISGGNLDISHDGTKLYVGSRASGNVTVLNSSTLATLSTISTGHAASGYVQVSQDGSKVYVCHGDSYTGTTSAGISVISTSTDTIVHEIGTGIYYSISLSPFNAHVTPQTSPVASLSASPNAINAGSSSTLSWGSAQAASATIDQGVGAVTPNASGTTVVSPSSSTTYTLTVVGSDGTTLTRTATVTVSATALVPGCTNPTALNYNSLATVDDGSCTYPPPSPSTPYEYTLTYEDIPTPNDVESIPRIRTTMKRRTGGTLTAPSRGKTLLIIGCALDGPTDHIVSLQDLRQASTLYGPQLFNADYPAPAGSSALNGYWSGNTLLKSIGETKGISDVRLLRVGGTFAQGQDLVPGLHLKALYAGASYNGASVTLTSDLGATVFAVTPPRTKGRPYTLRIPSGRTLEQLCNIFNSDPRNQAFILSVDGSSSRMTAQTISPEISTSVLSGGNYGTEYDLYPTPADLYTALLGTATWDIIQGSNEDMIYVAGIYADDDIGSPNHSFALDLGQLCIDKSIEGFPTLATIGLRPLNNPNLRTVSNRVASLSTPSFTYDPDGRVNVAQFLSDGLTNAAGEDLGRFVSICAGPDLIFTGNDLNAYVESPACWYASFACSTVSPSTTTNKSVPSDLQPNWRFTHKQLNLLNGGVGFGGENAININATEGGGAYVALKQQPFGRGWCIVEDVTTSPRNSAFAHLYVSRILKSAEEVVQSVTYPYIGQTNASAVITAMDRQLTQALDKFAGTGALQGARDSGYGYRLWSTVEGQFLGIIYLTLWLLPVGEIHRIDSIITVTG